MLHLLNEVREFPGWIALFEVCEWLGLFVVRSFCAIDPRGTLARI